MNLFMSLKGLVCFFCLFFMSLGHSESVTVQKVDVVVLGGGAAGLTSGIYLGRAGFSTLVLDGPNPGGAITQSNMVYNWPGYKEISGLELMDQLRGQAEKNGAVLCEEKLVSANLSQHPFSFTVQNVYDKSKKRQIIADACIIAMGAEAKRLEVAGEKTYWSKGVYTCAVCDGALYKDKLVAVVGGGDAALLEADYLAGIAKKVYVFNRKDKFKGVEKVRGKKLFELPNVEVLYNVSVKEIKGNGSLLESVTLLGNNGDHSEIKLDALFLAIGATPNTQFFSKELQLDSLGYVVLKKGCETSIPGVFAAGDVADPIFKQAIIASGDGAKAAMQAIDYLQLVSLKKAAPIEISVKKEEGISKVIEISSLSQLKEIVTKNKQLILLDFYATWCGPCRYLGKFMDQWAKELQGKAIICKVNVDLAGDIAMRYKVQSMPTFVILDVEGKEIARKVGIDEITQYINQIKK